MPEPRKGEALDARTLDGETREGFDKSGLAARLGRYGKARENALQFARYLEKRGRSSEQKTTQEFFGGLAIDLQECGNYAVFRDYFTVGQIRLSRFCTCRKHLICPLCAIRRGAKALRVYLGRVEHLLAENPRLRAYIVTFTVKNGDDLEERFKHLSGRLRVYHRRRSRKNTESEILKASSAVWSYEFTNLGKGWHPHVHAIWLSEERPDPFKLSDEWREITGDSYIVDVTPMDMTDPVGAFCEVFKYAIKFADLADDHRLHAFLTLKGKRLLDSFGDLRGLKVDPSDSDDLLDDLPYIERIFAYVHGVGYVEKEATGEVFRYAHA